MGLRYQKPGSYAPPLVASDHLYNFSVSGFGSRGVNLTLVGNGKITPFGLYNDASNYAGYLGAANGTLLDPGTGDFTLVYVFQLSEAPGNGINAYVVASASGFNSNNHWWIFARGDSSGKYAVRGFTALSSGYHHKAGEVVTVVYQRVGGVGTMHIKGARSYEIESGADTMNYYNRTGNPITFLGPTNAGGSYARSAGYAQLFDLSLGVKYEAKSLANNPWQVFRPSPNIALLKTSAATGAALGVSAVTAPVVGSMAFNSQPAFALDATMAAIQGAMSFGPASRVAVNATTGDTVGSMAFKSQPVFGVAATTGQTLGSMAFKSQPSLGVNAQTAPIVGSMAFGPSARLSVSATLAPTVGNVEFVAQPKFAVAAQTAPAVGSMAFGPSSRLTITGETAPAVGSMAFKSQPVLAVAAQTAPAVGSMAFAVSPQFGVLATLSPAVGSMAFLSGYVADIPGELCLEPRRLGTISSTIRKAATLTLKAPLSMSCEPLTVGDSVRVLISVKDIDGTPVNPATLAVTVQAPDGTAAPAALQSTGVGAYYFDIDLALPGTYAYRALATGNVKAAGQGGVFVSPAIF